MSKIGVSLCRVAIPLGLTIAFVSSVTAKKTPAISPTGREIFMDRCGACHGEDGKGNGPAVGALKTAPGDLTLLAKKNGGTFPSERVKEIVGGWADLPIHGSREMPIWGKLFGAKNPADQQIANDRFQSLVSFLESIQQ